jgi:GT2 family glycosyltransferase
MTGTGMPLTEVAVVIPAYNAERTLPETLASLLAQSYSDFTAVVVDDGSTDATAHVAAANTDPRVSVLSVPNGGVATARNRGIAATQSTYVAFLERQVKALQASPQAGICVTGAIRIDAQSHELGEMPLWDPADVGMALLLHSMVVGCLSSGLVRRSLLTEVGLFDSRFSQSADWDLWLRLASAASFAVVPDALVRYRTSAGNMSSNVPLLERDTFAVLDSFFDSPASAPYMGIRSLAYSRHWLVCAGSYAQVSRYRDAIRCTLQAAATHPYAVRRALGMPGRSLSRALARLKAAE